MGKWCAICETRSGQCVMPAGHALCGNDAEGLARRQEILFGKWEEERRVDAEKGRETKEFQWQGQAMEESEARTTWRAHGKGVAVQLAAAREVRIGRQKCDVCMVARTGCEWPEAHFSERTEWVAFCNEVGARVLRAEG